MGYIVHRIIVVTTWSTDPEKGLFPKVIAKAAELELPISPVLASDWNAYDTIVTIPHGGNEGSDPQVEHQAKLEAFADYLESLRYNDGSTALEWFATEYGSDLDAVRVIRHGCDHRTD